MNGAVLRLHICNGTQKETVMLEWIQTNMFNWTSWTEWLGLAAAAFVLVSFLMKDERNIRLVNIIGAGVFVVYGLMIRSASVWFMNLALVIVHVVRLCKIGKNNSDNVDTQTSAEQQNDEQTQQ